MSHGGMHPETAAQIKAATEVAEAYKDDARQDIQTDVMNAFYKGVVWGREHLPELPDNPMPAINHTLGGFKGAFFCIHKRIPTEQEIYDAGVRDGIDRMDMHIKAALA